MLKTSSIVVAFLLSVVGTTAGGQEYSVEVIDAAPQADAVSSELAEHFSAQGIRLKKGTSRTVIELWFCKQWAIDTGFEPTAQRLYPFSPGELIGLLHFPRKGSEFRDQTIGSGWYTLRFGLQPIDGNHVGTSATRDFLLMVAAEQDGPDKQWELDGLDEKSAEAAGTSHPAIFSLQPASAGSPIGIRHDESNDWWIVHTVGKGTVDGKSKDLPIDLVVVGHAAE